MVNFDCGTKEDTREHNPNQPQIADHACGILVIGVIVIYV